jgi:hypothetical protein
MKLMQARIEAGRKQVAAAESGCSSRVSIPPGSDEKKSSVLGGSAVARTSEAR